MKRCSYCGKENDDDAAICRACGTQLEASVEQQQTPPVLPGNDFITLVVSALFLAICLAVASAACGVLVNPAFPACLSLAAGVWGAFDARELRRKHLARGWPETDLIVTLHCFRPIIVCWLCAVPWPLGFAWYLVMRKARLITALRENE